MTSIERTAYPRVKRRPSARELADVYTPTVEDLAFIRATARGPSSTLTLTVLLTTRGGEWAGPCPFCGGQDRFRVQPEKGLWFCRQCSPDGRWQDAIAFAMRRDGVPFAEACRTLGASRSELGESVRTTQRREERGGQLSEDLEVSALWRERGVKLGVE